MASAVASTPETLVTLKVTLDGTTRRFKLPLRDLGASSLEPKLRGLLGISQETETLFERYSDSAGAFVTLDPGNVSVYKQLYRAAKAKQKLKLRLTTKEEVVQESRGPKPVTVEDEPETEQAQQTEASQPAPVKEETTNESGAPLLPSLPVQPPLSLSATLDREIPTVEPTPAPAQPEYMNPFVRATHQMSEMRKKVQEREAELAKLAAARAIARSMQVSKPYVRTNFAVYCNSCDRSIPESHYHCSTCDDGDFDLCQDCVDRGISCYGTDHWLIKRFVKDSVIINSTTERIAPKPKAKVEPKAEVKAEPVLEDLNIPAALPRVFADMLYANIRTCNSCVKELSELEFVHCTTCEDFDLCKDCFAKDEHGHHPKHGFTTVVEGSQVNAAVARRLAPGRAKAHSAICDGCDDAIVGIRHKCLDCPDWDYCTNCVADAAFVHPNHRFVPIYENLENAADMQTRYASRPIHYGICCDGPLCASAAKSCLVSYIVGDRYKCAVCNDTDFCANCEASPANEHNRTHPLIKFKTPVRSVSVSTTGEHGNGQPMPMLGDRLPYRPAPASTSSRATETNNESKQLSTNLLTVVDVEPSEPSEPTVPVKVEAKQAEAEQEPKKPVVAAEKVPCEKELVATYQRDTIADGTVFPPHTVFEQTWLLRNDGETAWPAGCSVKYMSGDYMGHLDPDHPAAIGELVSSSESTISYAPVAPGEQVSFTVLLRSPIRSGRYVSNWRLTTKDGLRFGHRLWCDIAVERPVDVKKEEELELPTRASSSSAETKMEESQMIFPKLEKESPVSSIYAPAPASLAAPSTAAEEEDEFEDCAQDEGWAEDESEEGFLTDEEYDVLDASDEEYLEEQNKKVFKK